MYYFLQHSEKAQELVKWQNHFVSGKNFKKCQMAILSYHTSVHNTDSGKFEWSREEDGRSKNCCFSIVRFLPNPVLPSNEPSLIEKPGASKQNGYFCNIGFLSMLFYPSSKDSLCNLHIMFRCWVQTRRLKKRASKTDTS